MDDHAHWRIYGAQGCGNAIVEAALLLAGIPFESIAVDLRDADERARLAALNPLVEVPTAIMPDGTIMTESAAMVLLIAELAPSAELAPPPWHPDRAKFLRWLTFLVAAIYPTFTYGDEPTRYVADGDALRAACDERARMLWAQVEDACGAPFFLGDALSGIDLFLAVMTRWRPRRAWFAEHCPRLAAVAREVDGLPALAPLWDVHFGAGA